MMKYDPHKHHRRSIRLKGYDYSQAGFYFVTICVQGGLCLLEKTAVREMIQTWWEKLPEKFPSVILDAFIIMPNHLHFIIVITNDPVGADPRVRPETNPSDTVGADPCVRPETNPSDTVGADPRVRPETNPSDTVGAHPRVRPILGTIVQWFKTMTTNAYIRGVKEQEWKPFPGRLWQRNYYEHIIRNERALNAIREYIHNNPANWEKDKLHPDAPPNSFNQSW